ncbi:hypothetical protein sos41_09470 [Alphaproteobacteria bacterium SO-S41]|nr:hypothetical protein sos41_09470 [Alphaproteobacteria bacterium SO-S41]
MAHGRVHHHHHAPRAGFSLLRASAVTRLGIVALSAGVLWLSVGWALGWV